MLSFAYKISREIEMESRISIRIICWLVSSADVFYSTYPLLVLIIT